MGNSVNYDENVFQIEDGELIGYHGPGGVVEIPEGITVIGCGAFRDCAELTEVIIPEGVEEIKGGVFCVSERYESFGAFERCSSLKRISFPKSLREIGRFAFENCTSLRELSLPEGLIKIKDSAFEGCKSLEKIHFPDSLKSVCYCAFANCISLHEIFFPRNLTYIGGWAFCDCTGLTDLVVPDNVKTVDAGAFRGCTSLRSAVISAQVKELEGTFYGCTALTEVMLPEGMERLSYSGPLWEKSGVFENCTSLEQIELPAGSFLWIGAHTFRGCEKLKEITVPARTWVIDEKAFSGCSELRQVTIEGKVRNIERGAFEKCVALTEILIPDSVETIKSEAFRGCTGMMKISIPDSVQKIGSDAFRGCTNLAAVEISDHTVVAEGAFSDTAYVSDRRNWKNGILCLGNRVLQADPEKVAGEVILSLNLTEICDGAFRDCAGMTAVTFPPGIQKIGSEVFRGCTGVKKVEVSDYHLVKGISPVNTYRHLIPNGFLKPVIPYDGEVFYPEGFEELLEGRSIPEQLTLFRMNADRMGKWQDRNVKNTISARVVEVDEDAEAILVKDGKVAGVKICGKVCLPEHSVVTGYSELENNGAGYKGGEPFYGTLNCVPPDFEERGAE